MKRISFLVALAVMVAYASGVYAQTYAESKNDSIDISITTQEHPLDTPANWAISIKDGDYDAVTPGADITSLDTSAVTLTAMSYDEKVLGRVFLQLAVWDLYEVVVYSNAMDLNSDGTPDLPWNWDLKTANQKDDFIARHAGLQIQDVNYLDNEGFNPYLYGASLKVRSEGIHGTAVEDDCEGLLRYEDTNSDGKVAWPDTGYGMNPNDVIPVQVWDANLYEETVQFSPIPELAVETYSAQLPTDAQGNPASLVKVAGSVYGSPIVVDGQENWLEMIFGASEENTGGTKTYSTTVYFDLRWN